MPDPLNPPAIVQSAEKDEKWDIHVKAAVGFAKRSTEQVIIAGRELIKGKMLCPHGRWLPTLKKHGISHRTASYAMGMARRFEKLATVSDLNEAVAAFEDALSDPQTEPPERQVGDEAEENPVLVQLIVCPDCRRKGRTPGCPKCQKRRHAFLHGSNNGRSKKRKGGSVLFSWRSYETHLSAIYNLPDRLAKAYPDTAKSSEHHEASRLLDQLARVVEKLQKLVEGVK